ncbi:MAG: TetR/AcrR family transcriptional regulator [Desulfocapsa sp.]|nr:TetR/AcrR family transcriptional regulator [Desulfocapsa sp.]
MKPFTKRQKQIIEASINLIADRSIHALTIKNIAKEIKLTEGAIYRHFASKNDILLGIVQMFQQTAEKSLKESCHSDLPALEQIEQIFSRHVQFFIEKPAVTAVIFSESIFQSETNLSKQVFKLLELHEKALHCIIERGQKQNEIRSDLDDKELIRIIIGSIRYTVTKWRLSDYKFDLKEECALILKGLKKLLISQ